MPFDTVFGVLFERPTDKYVCMRRPDGDCKSKWFHVWAWILNRCSAVGCRCTLSYEDPRYPHKTPYQREVCRRGRAQMLVKKNEVHLPFPYKGNRWMAIHTARHIYNTHSLYGKDIYTQSQEQEVRITDKWTPKMWCAYKYTGFLSRQRPDHLRQKWGRVKDQGL